MKIATFLYASLLSASFIFASSNTDSLSSGKTTSWSVKQCQEKLDLLNKEIPAEALDAKITLAEVQAKASQMLEQEKKKPEAISVVSFQKNCSLYVELIQVQAKTQVLRKSLQSLWQKRMAVMQTAMATKDSIEFFYKNKTSVFASALEEEKERLALTSEELRQRAKAREDSLREAAKEREAALQKALDEERQKAEARQQEAKNKLNELQSKLIQVTQDARGIILSMSDILFDVNKASLKGDLKTSLAKVAGILSVYQELNVSVEGHTDNTGSEEHNLKLSEQRAQNVLDFLVAQGIEASRLTSKGYGMTLPIADNKTKEGRQKNRRVDLVIKDKAL